MKIIVVGGGKVGTALCRSLVAENHDVILIEKDESVLNLKKWEPKKPSFGCGIRNIPIPTSRKKISWASPWLSILNC